MKKVEENLILKHVRTEEKFLTDINDHQTKKKKKNLFENLNKYEIK